MLNIDANRVLDVELLQTFHLACALGTLGAVAKRRHLTLGAVSQQIKRLEQQIDRQLLTRSRAGISPTAAGAELRVQSVAFMAEHDKLLAGLIGESVSGIVRMGLPEEYTPRLLDSVLPALGRSYPRIQVHVQTATSGELERLLNAGTLDLAIAVKPESETQSLLRLWKTRPVWAGSATQTIDPRQPLPLALHPTDCPYRAIGLDALQTAKRDWKTVFASPSVAAVESAVSSGLAISVLDRARLNPSMRALDHDQGLTPLPECFACLLVAPAVTETTQKAVSIVSRQLQTPSVTAA